jgi:hypothetical protein
MILELEYPAAVTIMGSRLELYKPPCATDLPGFWVLLQKRCTMPCGFSAVYLIGWQEPGSPGPGPLGGFWLTLLAEDEAGEPLHLSVPIVGVRLTPQDCERAFAAFDRELETWIANAYAAAWASRAN